jgi:hypothetical protein
MPKLGFDEDAWEAAKAEGRDALISCARNRQMIPYSDFVKHIQSIQFQGPHDARLAHFLEEISEAEAEAGRGMLTALVVHKHGDYQPGPGFFELARRLGHNTSDIEKFWVQEVKKVFAAWVD